MCTVRNKPLDKTKHGFAPWITAMWIAVLPALRAWQRGYKMAAWCWHLLPSHPWHWGLAACCPLLTEGGRQYLCRKHEYSNKKYINSFHA